LIGTLGAGKKAGSPEEGKPMTKAEIDSYYRQLLELKKRLGGDLAQLEEEALSGTGGERSGNLSDVPVHPADLGTDNYEEELTLGLMENQDQILTEVDDALDRILRGTFGFCEVCGREISKGRLDALPYTRYCIEHAREFPERPVTE
jgi:DnaK suppressor protein